MIFPALAEAFGDSVRELFVKPKISFDIIVIEPQDDWMDDSIQAIRKVSKIVPLEIKYIKNIEQGNFNFNQSAVILGTRQSIRLCRRFIRLTNFPKELKFLISLDNIDFKTPSNYVDKPNTKFNIIQFYEYFLQSTKNTIDLITFEWYTPKAFVAQLNSYKKLKNVHGDTFDVLDVVGSKANFTVYRQHRNFNFTTNKAELKPHNKLILNPQIIANIEDYRDDFYHMTSTFENKVYRMIINKGEKYTSYEKLLKPFDITTWRVFFEMMAGDVRKNVPTTLEGLLEENYTIILQQGEKSTQIFESTITQSRKVSIKYVDHVHCPMERAGKKSAFLSVNLEIEIFKIDCYDPFLVLKETFLTLPVAFMTRSNHFMYHAINEVVDVIIPTGIPQHWFQVQWNHLINGFDHWDHSQDFELKSFILDDWDFGFHLWLICCGISFLVFIIEFSQWPKIKEIWSKKWKVDNVDKINKIRMIQVRPYTKVDVCKEVGEFLDFETWEIKG
ncbi:hypothetical protein PVAND_003289 [Polypedilum vanderplanki]|uniref:Uncharacterized protein n=1 Tax=Polypedilum vanderplanki TaxID=319348 RepID=A0A9J6BTL1_POLVA|nr:hypothetical protein PVAND_003289 [Polypedilum vanderplanki]